MQSIVQIKRMKIYIFCNPMPKIDLNRISSKNFLRNGLVRPLYKFAKSVTKIKNKVREFKTNNKAINDFIYRNKWYKTIDKEL